MEIYFDNAATTPLSPKVKQAMMESLEVYGNPSSTHAMGRKSKSLIENSRKKIAKLLNASSRDIVFTSGGTESNNYVLQSAVQNLGVKKIISTDIEHAAVTNVVTYLADKYKVELVYVPFDERGVLDYDFLEKEILESTVPTLVSIMQVNNELGNINDIQKIGAFCATNSKVYFHSDMVQSIGKIPVDLKELKVDFASCSAHKFYGPKGIGFLYAKSTLGLKPLLIGGAQENGRRAGTGSPYLIHALTVALTEAIENINEISAHTIGLKKYAIEKLKEIKEIQINGDMENSSPIILSLSVPYPNNMLSFNLDLKGIMLSQGSACGSGAAKLSKTFTLIYAQKQWESYVPLRLSFGKYNTKEEFDYFLKALLLILNDSKVGIER